MAGERFVLDSSALMTLIEDEEGADRVEADRRLAYLQQLPGEILWRADEAVLLRAARFKARQRVSLADAVIAAYASANGARLLHKDPEFEALADEVSLESLPWKK